MVAPGLGLDELSWPAAGDRAAAGAILAVPVGATEQHGPHLPVSTDTDIAVALCQALTRSRPDVVVAPAVAYGASGEHAGFPGTVSIGHAALEQLLVELGRSAADTFAHLLLVSAHGGNAETVTRAADRLRAESRDVCVHMPRWSGDPHAGRPETAMMLALRPSAVDMSRVEPGNPASVRELWPQLRTAGVRAVSPNGILGDPTGATAAEGFALLGRLGADLEAQVARWRAGAVSGQ